MNTMSYENAKLVKDAAWDSNRLASEKLRAIPGISSGPFGTTPDHVKETPEYKEAMANFDRTFKNMREINQWFNRVFKKEIRAERKAHNDAMEKHGEQLRRVDPDQ